MTILVFGAGFLGKRLAQAVPGARLSAVDIADPAAVAHELEAQRPSAVVNAAGKTGTPNVDWCESHPHETARSNTMGPLILAEACAKTDTYLLHIGSGCVFYGSSPRPGGFREDDFANPISTYSRSKYAADLLLERLPNVGVVRLRMPIDSRPGARNLITKLASYPQVIDVENSVTVVDDLVKVITGLVEKRAVGIFHATNAGTMRHRDLLALYREIVDPSHRYELIREAELVERGLAREKRSNCILSSERLDAIGLGMRPIAEALPEVLREYARYVGK